MKSPAEFLHQLNAEGDNEQAERNTLRLSAMNMLARREHSYLELERKLHAKTENSTMIGAVLDQLVADNLLDDGRFSESFMRSRAEHGFGPYKIFQELQHKGIDEQTAMRVADQLNIDWLANARKLFIKRTINIASLDMKEKHKQARYLQSRGFSADITRAAMTNTPED